MTSLQPNQDPRALQRARATRLKDLLEPWSLRKLAARTGISKSVLDTRLSGDTALTMGDIEILAPVIRMTPEELFADLLTIRPGDKNGPASEEAGPKKLPGLDSNQEPIDSQLAPETRGKITRGDFGRAPARNRDTLATITSLSPRHASGA